MKKQNKKLKKVKRKVRRSTLFFLIFAFMMNAFAWFIYSNKVENSLTTGVKSWKVTFEQDGNDLMDHVTFEIDSIYPGMEDFSDKIEIKNSGEMDAYISYSLSSIRIMDEVYTSENYTSDEMISILQTAYPFQITFYVDKPFITTTETGTFYVQLHWPYESGNDELDTYWGKKSYEYKELHPDETQIEIVVNIKASQRNPQGD